MFTTTENHSKNRFSVELGIDWRQATIEVFLDTKRLNAPQTLALAERIAACDTRLAGLPSDKLDGEIELFVWESRKETPMGRHEWPLHTGDGIMVRVQLNRPAFVCVVWIASDGRAQPLFPWTGLEWNVSPKFRRVECLALPQEHLGGKKGYYPLDSPAGIETVVLLARDEPLASGLASKLQGVFKMIAANSASLQPRILLEPYLFKHQMGCASPSLAVRLGEPQVIDDPVLNVTAETVTKFSERFPLIVGISFANAGKPRK